MARVCYDFFVFSCSLLFFDKKIWEKYDDKVIFVIGQPKPAWVYVTQVFSFLELDVFCVLSFYFNLREFFVSAKIGFFKNVVSQTFNVLI